MNHEPVTICLPSHDCVVLSDGREALVIDDDTERLSFPSPVKSATIVARLRAIADLIESPDLLDGLRAESRAP